MQKQNRADPRRAGRFTHRRLVVRMRAVRAPLRPPRPGSASRGGLYQGAKISEFVPEFASVASRIEPGEISQIFETEFGLHILRVNDRRGDIVDLNQILIRFDFSISHPTRLAMYGESSSPG